MRTPGALLVLDTDHAIADLISEILRDEGDAVSIARNRSETLVSIAKQRPALGLLDDHTADLDAACLHAHVGQQYHSVPVVTTTHRAVATVRNARDSWSSLVEPFSLDALVTYISYDVPLLAVA